MRKFVSIAVLIILASFSNCFIDRETYEEIKSKAAFEVMDFEEHQKMFEGVKYEEMFHHKGENHLMSQEMKEQYEIESQKSFLSTPQLQGVTLPAEFDWRKVMPDCHTPIKDQKYCGSCYSFSVTASLESRFCIKSQGKLKPELSQQDIISCDNNNGKCQGDRLDNTWRYVENVGTVPLYCKPYESAYGSVPTCTNYCVNKSYTFARWRALPGSWRMFYTVDQIKAEIYMNGPVSAGMATFEDFSTYKGGIYIHVAGKQTDYHAVVILGWGYDPYYRSEYWILRNSWGPTWGESGYFKILMGMYEVESMVSASLPLV